MLISGAGKTIVEFLSTPISTIVCRLRSWSASGWAIITSEARPSSPAASASPSAAMIFARFSRSASAWRAIARCMLSGSWMSLSSTTVTLTPQSSVWTSRISRMFALILSVSDSVSSSVWRPTTARSVVCAIWSIAASTFSIATTERIGVVDAEVGDRRDVDGDVVAGDDPLRLDRHRHDPQRDAVDAVDERDDEDQARARGRRP